MLLVVFDQLLHYSMIRLNSRPERIQEVPPDVLQIVIVLGAFVIFIVSGVQRFFIEQAETPCYASENSGGYHASTKMFV